LSASAQGQLSQLRETYGFHNIGSYYQNAWGASEKWFQDRQSRWFALTPDGKLVQFNGVSFASSPRVATLDPVVYDDPTLLFNAPVTLSAVAQAQLAMLEATYGFHYVGSYYLDTYHAHEKWFQDQAGTWYALLSNGDLIKWDGVSFASSALTPIATLDALVFDEPTLLLGA
jgi:hypothetical protein